VQLAAALEEVIAEVKAEGTKVGQK
jgi:hypothetical protein